MKFLDSWSRKFKIGILAVIFLLVLVIISGIAYYINYSGSCVPNKSLDECKTTLNETKLNLKDSLDKVGQLEAEKQSLLDDSFTCEQELVNCNSKLKSLNDSYNHLLNQFSELNESYNRLLLDYTSCQKNLSSKDSENKLLLDPTCDLPFQQNLTFSYVAISLISFFLFLSLPLKIEIGLDPKDKRIKRSISFFIAAFSISMFLLNYIRFANFWINLPISLFIGFLVGTLIYVIWQKNP